VHRIRSGHWGCTQLVTIRAFDDRKVHFLTRGNVDGIVSAALWLSVEPNLKVSFVPSGDVAVDVMRRDISSEHLILADLGLTPRLLKTFNDKANLPQRITYLDHHLGSQEMAGEIAPNVEQYIDTKTSAAGVVRDHLRLGSEFDHLVALADKVEYMDTPLLERVCAEHGRARMDQEARILDFAWRQKVEDDRFRYYAARNLAKGHWPSEVSEVKGRYLQIVNEGRWEKALLRVRERIQIKHEVALLQFGRRKPSLFGFGARAVSEVARQSGAKVAALVNRRPDTSSVSLRRTNPSELDLGALAKEFTQIHGIVGGGHPQSAGAKIPSKAVRELIHQVYCLA
jgi:single-stranded-DNA-specific exonuclease